MKKKLLCLLLCFATVFSVCALGGCATNSETDLDSNVNTSRNAVTIGLYIISEEKVSPETEKAVEAAFNEITEATYTTHVDIIYLTQDEYKAALDAQINKTVNRPAGTPIKPTTTGETYVKDEDGMTVLAYPQLGQYQMDIVLITGEDMLKEYVRGGHLLSLNDALTNTYKTISSYIYNDLLLNAKVNGQWYAVPNNQIIGEYTYLMVNRDLATKYYYRDYFEDATNVSFGVGTPVAELIDIVAANEDLNKVAPMYGMADYPLVKYWDIVNGGKSVISTFYPST